MHRNCTRSFLTVVLLLLGSAGTALGANDGIIVRLEGTKEQQFDNKPHLVVYVITAEGKEMALGVHNRDDSKYGVDPDTDLLAAIKAQQPGDVVKIRFKEEGKAMKYGPKIAYIDHMEPYPLEPGEELPNGYIFEEVYQRNENQMDHTFVDFKKFGDTVTFMVPEKKDKTGAGVPNPDLVAQLGKFTKGQVLLVDTVPSKPILAITSVELYTKPQIGKIKSIKTTLVDGARVTQAEIDVDGTVVTALVPGHLEGKRWITDPKVLTQLKRFHVNSLVSFRTTDDDGKTNLREIEAAPKPKPAAKEPTKSDSKMLSKNDGKSAK